MARRAARDRAGRYAGRPWRGLGHCVLGCLTLPCDPERGSRRTQLMQASERLEPWPSPFRSTAIACASVLTPGLSTTRVAGFIQRRALCNVVRSRGAVAGHRSCWLGMPEQSSGPTSALRVVARDAYGDWEAVYVNNVVAVYRLIFRHVGNRPDAEDLTEEVFLAALPRLRLPAAVHSVHAYLAATVKTVVADHWRRYYAAPPVLS